MAFAAPIFSVDRNAKFAKFRGFKAPAPGYICTMRCLGSESIRGMGALPYGRAHVDIFIWRRLYALIRNVSSENRKHYSSLCSIMVNMGSLINVSAEVTNGLPLGEKP